MESRWEIRGKRGWDQTVRLWNPTTLTCVHTYRDPPIAFEGMAWHPDGSLLAVGTYLLGMYVWDVRGRHCRWVGEPGQTAFHSAAWSPDGSLLAGGSNDGSVYLWRSTDGTRQHKLLGHHGNVMGLAWSPNGRFLSSVGGNRDNGELFVWDMLSVGTDRVLDTLTGTSHSPYSPCPMRCFVGHPNMVCAIAWSRWRDEKETVGTGPSPHPRDLSYRDQLISGGTDGLLRWWDVESGKCVCIQEAHQGTIRTLRVSPDGRWLASSGDDGAIKIWNLKSCSHVRTLRHDRPYERLNITGIRGLTEAQKESLQALGAIDEAAPEIEEGLSV